jgi:uncharacterized protein YgfB (UPF0149 family)
MGVQIDYEEFAEQLAAAHVEFSGAEVHGLFCGLFCGGSEDAVGQLYAELFQSGSESDVAVRECCDTLDLLLTETQSEIDEGSLGYTLFLPDDERPLSERARALADWCQGFLYGVGMVGLVDESELSSEANEALHDLTEITRMDLDSLGGDEEEEASLLEVTEYVWVATSLIREELISVNADTEVPSC